jgi:hypothetical protein
MAFKIVDLPLSPHPIRQFMPELGCQESRWMERNLSISICLIFATAYPSPLLRLVTAAGEYFLHWDNTVSDADWTIFKLLEDGLPKDCGKNNFPTLYHIG